MLWEVGFGELYSVIIALCVTYQISKLHVHVFAFIFRIRDNKISNFNFLNMTFCFPFSIKICIQPPNLFWESECSPKQVEFIQIVQNCKGVLKLRSIATTILKIPM